MVECARRLTVTGFLTHSSSVTFAGEGAAGTWGFATGFVTHPALVASASANMVTGVGANIPAVALAGHSVIA
jgi:hypothetical protein